MRIARIGSTQDRPARADTGHLLVAHTHFIAWRDLQIAAHQTFTAAIENRGVPARHTNHGREICIDLDLSCFVFGRQKLLDPLVPIAMTQIGETSFFLPVHLFFLL
jgi:hypothetical protein